MKNNPERARSLLGQVLEEQLQAKNAKPEIKKTGESPFQPGEELWPRKNVLEIRQAPKEKRPAMLKEFKEKLAYQKEGLAILQEKLIEKIRQNPDISYDELVAQSEKLGEPYGINWNQQIAINSVLFNYTEKHQAIREARKKYPDDNKFFEALFGRPPKGKIEIFEGPMTLYLRVHNLKDYTFIQSNAFLTNREPTNEEYDGANKTGGCLIVAPINSMPRLNKTITIENTSQLPNSDKPNQSIFIHEEQHAIKRLFNDAARHSDILENKLIDAVSEEEREQLLKRLLRLYREHEEHQTKDEILAFFKTGDTTEYIFDQLTKTKEAGGLYDRFASQISDIRKKMEEFLMPHWGNEAPPLIKKTAEKVYGIEAKNLLVEALWATEALLEIGFTREQMVAAFLPEPLRRWRKVAKRIIEEKR